MMVSFQCRAESLKSIALGRVTGAFFMRNGILVDVYRPLCERNAVLSRPRSLIFIFQGHELPSSVKSIAALPKSLWHSSMRGRSYKSKILTAFNFSESSLKSSEPPCVAVNTIGNTKSEVASSGIFRQAFILPTSHQINFLCALFYTRRSRSI